MTIGVGITSFGRWWGAESMIVDKRKTILSANTIMAKLTNHFQRTRLITSSTDQHYSLDSKDHIRSGCRTLTQSDDHTIRQIWLCYQGALHNISIYVRLIFQHFPRLLLLKIITQSLIAKFVIDTINQQLRLLQLRDFSYGWENYLSGIGWERVNLSLIFNLHCTGPKTD